MTRSILLILSLAAAFLLTACYDPVWQSIVAIPAGNQCASVSVTYTSTNPVSEPFTHVIAVYQVVGAADFQSVETNDILLNSSTRDGGYASKTEGMTQNYIIALDTPVPNGTQIYAAADSDQGPSPSYPSGSRFSAITVCNTTATLNVPNLGMIMITTSQAQPAYVNPGGQVIRINGQELWLPADADQSGFDTYVVAEVHEVDSAFWVGIFLGSGSWGWVPLDGVTPLVYITGTG